MQFTTKKQKKIIIDIFEHRLFGFELATESHSSLRFETVAVLKEKQDIHLRKMFLIIKESFALLAEDLKQGTFNHLDVVEDLTKRLGRYDNYCRRSTSKKRFVHERVSIYWTLYRNLLHIQHCLWHFYEYLSDRKPRPVSAKIIVAFKHIAQQFETIHRGYYKRDIQSIQKVHSQSKRLQHNQIISLMEKSRGKEAVVMHYIAEVSRLIDLLTSPVFGILL